MLQVQPADKKNPFSNCLESTYFSSSSICQSSSTLGQKESIESNICFCQAVRALKNEIIFLKEMIQQKQLSFVLLGNCYYLLSIYELDKAFECLSETLKYYQSQTSTANKSEDKTFDRIESQIEETKIIYGQTKPEIHF